MAGITGKDSLSIKKQDVSQSKVPALGFKKTVFAHKATSGQTVISLSSLTTPTEMTANGFAQPSLQELTAVNIRQFKENFTLTSSLRGILQPFLGYVVIGGTSLKLLFNAEDGEIFTGVFDANPRTFTSAADAVPISVSGTLLAGQTDFNVGTAFNVGLFPSSQHGAIMVFANDRLVYRNTTPTSLGTADGDYYEVLAGNGQGTMIRFNQADPVLDRSISVVSIGSLIQAPTGSEIALIEALQGQIDSIVPTLAALAGVSESVFQGAPNNVNLKAFGDTVLSQGTRVTNLETTVNRQSSVLTNTVGSVNYSSITSNQFQALSGNSVTLPAGVWEIEANFYCFCGAAGVNGFYGGTGLYGAQGTNSATAPASIASLGTVSSVQGYTNFDGNLAATSDIILAISAVGGQGQNVCTPPIKAEVTLTGTTTIYAVTRAFSQTPSNGFFRVTIQARRKVVG